MIRVLVLCTGNACRSQMAEGFLRHYGGESVEVHSAGIEAHGVNPNAVRVMSEIGIDISGHTSDNIGKYVDERFDFVITVCDNAAERCPVFPGKAERLHWPFEDPGMARGSDAEVLDQFRRIRDSMEARIRKWLAESGLAPEGQDIE